MKRILLFTAVACLAGCSSREKTYSDTSGASSSSGTSQDQQTAVIQPSELSPEQVRTVQRSLAERGFAVDPSGKFDDRTQTALMDFQRARGLPATGNLNNATVEALGIDPRDVMPVHGTRPAPAGDRASGSSGSSSTGSGSTGATSPAEPSHPSTQDQPQSPTDTGSSNVRNPTASPPKPGY